LNRGDDGGGVASINDDIGSVGLGMGEEAQQPENQYFFIRP